MTTLTYCKVVDKALHALMAVNSAAEYCWWAAVKRMVCWAGAATKATIPIPCRVRTIPLRWSAPPVKVMGFETAGAVGLAGL